MNRILARLRDKLGVLALASLALLGACALFYALAVKPLEARSRALEHELSGAARRLPADGWTRVSAEAPAAKLAAFYRFFERPEDRVEWLARLQGMAAGAGVELRSAEYRLAQSAQPLERYQISLPVTASYAQIRAFVESALAGIPVLSLDQVSFRRRNANDARLEAEIVLTLHLLRK